MAGATAEESKVLAVFRGRVEALEGLDEEERSDKHLLRWLRARDLDVSKAEEMIRKSLEWRRDNRIDSSLLAFRPPAFYSHKFPLAVTGFDDEGCPVVIAPLWDIRPVASGQRATFIRFVDQTIFRIATICKNRGITQFVFVSDLQGFEWKHLKSRAALEVLLDMVRSFEANYPETLKVAIAINAPKIFTILFNLMKPLLTARTLAKVEICGQDPDVWKPVLLARIPANRLPVKYGGLVQDEEIAKIMQDKDLGMLTRTSDGACHVASDVEDQLHDGHEQFTTIEVGAGEKFDVELCLPKPNTLLTWSLQSEKNDIGFMVHLKNGEDVGHIVVPYERQEQQEGAVVCTQPGFYVCTFDNTFSRFRAKLVKYLIRTLSSDQINVNPPL